MKRKDKLLQVIEALIKEQNPDITNEQLEDYWYGEFKIDISLSPEELEEKIYEHIASEISRKFVDVFEIKEKFAITYKSNIILTGNLERNEE